MNLDNIQKLLGLVDQFKIVKRNIYNAGTTEKENDAEHSYELAILSWFLALEARKNDIHLDFEKVIKYALAHDLVEAYAGDTDAFDQNSIATKNDREHKALERIKDEFHFFPELSDSIIAYENQSDPESIFVKSLDKIQPVLSNIRGKGLSWKQLHSELALEDLVELKERTIKDKTIYSLWLNIKNILETTDYLPKK